MKNTKTPWIISALILIVFTAIFIYGGNYEFLIYIAVIGLLIIAIAISDRFFKYSNIARWGFVTWLFLHMSGGAIWIKGTRLYDTVLIDIVGAPYYILRYDQFAHILSFFVMALFVYAIISTIIKPEANKALIMATVFAATMGVGAVHEITEFSTVVLFNSTGVGNYFNNALDLIFNSIGIIIALFFVNNKLNKRKKKR